MVIDFIKRRSARAGISPLCLVGWMAFARWKYYQWKDRHGKVNEHKAFIPRGHWPEQGKGSDSRLPASIPSGGLPSAHFTMLDRDIVAVGLSSTYRVLRARDCWIPGSPSPR
jgi:hypothetical protein